eukprot:7768960-Pyramimonas_sp.AAC.1
MGACYAGSDITYLQQPSARAQSSKPSPAWWTSTASAGPGPTTPHISRPRTWSRPPIRNQKVTSASTSNARSGTRSIEPTGGMQQGFSE